VTVLGPEPLWIDPLWTDAVPPCVCELEDKWYLGSGIIDSRPKSARRARPSWSISMSTLAGKLGEVGVILAVKNAPPSDPRE